MTINTPGDLERLKKPQKFQCMYCGCDFTAEYGEYELSDYVEYARLGIDALCECPTCKLIAYSYTNA